MISDYIKKRVEELFKDGDSEESRDSIFVELTDNGDDLIEVDEYIEEFLSKR